MQEDVVCNTVGELIEALKALPSDLIVHGPNPPFDGVKLIPQGGRYLLIGSSREWDGNKEDVYGRPRAAA